MQVKVQSARSCIATLLCNTPCIPVCTASYNSFHTVTKKWIAIGKSRVLVKVIRTEVLRGFTKSFQALIEIRPQPFPNTGFPTNWSLNVSTNDTHRQLSAQIDARHQNWLYATLVHTAAGYS